MSRKFTGNFAAVDRTIADAISALDSYTEPDPREAFRQVGYVMSALYKWARERERERNREICQAVAEGRVPALSPRPLRPKSEGKAPF
jgi:hypothetical protein